MMCENKSRNLSVAEYFLVAQKEYLIFEFKRKIYHNPSDKRYFKRVMKYKKEKIENISKRNRLNSIFNSSEKMEEVRNHLFDKLGKPKFDLSEKDIDNYFSPGNEFSYKGEIWILDQINNNGKLTIYSKSSQCFEEVDKTEICRIL